MLTEREVNDHFVTNVRVFYLKYLQSYDQIISLHEPSVMHYLFEILKSIQN